MQLCYSIKEAGRMRRGRSHKRYRMVEQDIIHCSCCNRLIPEDETFSSSGLYPMLCEYCQSKD